MSETGFSFCEARRANNFLFCSGQIGLTADGKAPEQPEDQFAAAFAALADVLQKNGCTLGDVVDLTSFHVGYPAHMETFMQVMGRSMPGIEMAWTAIGVAGLGYPGSLVELKAVAVLPNAGADHG
ncbi:RidA family protein (plasmid) [Novosphingobium sp. THN1]|jgi:enamine deaminase RidA (YjgF/YER057c/UK114 family)|uniref:RidA family protein n=1 Tax=Novosphingobium sp. THN1 TaxID=1016987 RepID=UPI000E471779|nr:RidA family protein [Novosphingobium sp. THN1]AXU21429.1 RidA family protein [Novosphingobium sp. THN1]MBS0476717.1 RidA family protein [Pseudomonadota bacterium]